jgi:hypothetical protein
VLAGYRKIGTRKWLMYRRPRFLEVLHAIREEMSRDADYDVDLFAEMVRSGVRPLHGPERIIRGFKSRAPKPQEANGNLNGRKKRKRAASKEANSSS